MQEKSVQSLNLLKEAIKLSDKAVFTFDVESGKFLYLNSEFERIVELPMASVNPTSLIDKIHPDDRGYLLENYREIISGIKKQDIEFRIENQSGAQKWLNLSAQSFQEAETTVIVGLLEDISKWKKQEKLLQKFASKKNSILEILSHDLAGPLNNIKGLSSAIAEELQGHKLPQLDKMVKMIEDTSERSINLIRDFVQYEFLESENSTLVKERVDLVERLKFIIDQYKNSEKDIKKTFQLNTSADPILVEIDPYKFSQVINNLISNAIKFTADDGKITVTLEDKENSVIVSVADNGIGIPKKYHENLFQKFTKARRSGLKGEPSTGLGMSIIKTIVEWHGGKIWFESKVDEGSKFYIEIPKE